MVIEPSRKVTIRNRPYLNQKIRESHERLKEILKNPEQRAILKSKIRTYKKEDSAEHSYPQYRGAGEGRRFGHRPIAEYYAFYQRNGAIQAHTLLEIVGKEIEKKGFVRVLDAGAGYGQALSELKSRFGAKVETHALVLKATGPLLQAAQEGRVDKIHKVEISAFLPKQEYDIIISFFGATRYTPQREVALKKLLHSLAVGGVAYIQYDLLDEDTEITPILKKFKEENPNYKIDLNTYYETAKITRIR